MRAPASLKTAEATGSGIKISALRECPFYSARKIDNVKVGPSPNWLQAKIESVGIRSINNIVDISNFVMLELGQPTHAFDADKLRGGIDVRLARNGEKFLALDGKTYSLAPESLVIADDERAVAIGGVMGGEDTGVTESTRTILLESAYFLPASIRRTARKLNLPSDASYRFERGVGITIEPKTIDKILERFGLSKGTRLRQVTAGQTSKSRSPARQSRSGDGATWKIPSYRRDLQRDVDLIEEVVRAYGVEKITGTDRSRFTPSSVADDSHDLESALRSGLVTRGLAEVRTSKLIPRSATVVTTGNAIKLRNPLSEDHVALRPNLRPGLLAVLDRNVRAGAERVTIFELGRVFVPASGKEERHLGVLLWGDAADSPHWRTQTKRRLDFFDLKGAIESLHMPILRSKHKNQRKHFARLKDSPPLLATSQ